MLKHGLVFGFFFGFCFVLFVVDFCRAHCCTSLVYFVQLCSGVLNSMCPRVRAGADCDFRGSVLTCEPEPPRVPAAAMLSYPPALSPWLSRDHYSIDCCSWLPSCFRQGLKQILSDLGSRCTICTFISGKERIVFVQTQVSYCLCGLEGYWRKRFP